ncbi:NACHT domain-containing protein [Endothiovibrio diazotrophicus]
MSGLEEIDTEAELLFGELPGHVRQDGPDGIVLPGSNRTRYDVAPLLNYLRAIPRSKEFITLPPLLADQPGLPIVSMYVELAVSQDASHPAPLRLSDDGGLFEASDIRFQRRVAGALPLEEALDDRRHRGVVILGDPGSGKTSLLRRLALSIARGEWPRWRLPVFVSLRRYWQDFRSWNHPRPVTLSRYAAFSLYAQRTSPDFVSRFPNLVYNVDQEELENVERLREAMTLLWREPAGQVVFLLDGLDEIAGDREAYRTVVDAIHQLAAESPAFSWVLTSRRAGFYGEVGEDIRYEVVDLDHDGICQLVQKWFEHMVVPLEEADRRAHALYEELSRDHRLLSMARNPYLLTLLCTLRHRSTAPLPLNRAEVYEQVIRQARLQLQAVMGGDITLFSLSDLERLSAFCHYLYTDAPDAPRQLFDEDDWERFGGPGGRAGLRVPYMESRLLDQWGEFGSGYHLMHLSLHEFLVARHLAEVATPEEMADRLYEAHWRVTVRFYGALLWRARRHDRFFELMKLQLREVDLAGLLYVEAARMLLEVDTGAALKGMSEDLREILWELWLEDEPYVADAAGRALAMIDPAGLLARLQTIIEDPPEHPSAPEIWAAIYRWRRHGKEQDLSIVQRAVRLLGAIRLPEATALLLELFEHGGRLDAMAEWAATTLGAMEGRAVRRLILDRVAGADTESPLLKRLCEVATCSAHRDYLAPLLEWLETAEDYPLFQVLRALQALRTTEAVPALLRRLERGVEGADQRLTLLETIACCGGGDARAWFAQQLESEALARRDELIFVGAAWEMVPAEVLLEHLDGVDPETRQGVIDELGESVRRGNRLPEAVVERMLEATSNEDPEEATFAGTALAHVVRTWSDYRREPYLTPFLQAFETPGSPLRGTAAFLLAHVPDVRLGIRVAELCADDSEEERLRASALNGLTIAAKGGGHPVSERVVELIAPLVHSESPVIASGAADVIAALAFTRLLPYRELKVARDALARVCAERGILIFREFYVTSGGRQPMPVRVVDAADPGGR